MTSDHSFDPRTWRATAEPPAAPPIKLAPSPVEAPPKPGEPARADWLGLALAVTILLAGAAVAYALRPAAGAPGSAALSTGASANG